jgi:hypothetical protein
MMLTEAKCPSFPREEPEKRSQQGCCLSLWWSEIEGKTLQCRVSNVECVEYWGWYRLSFCGWCEHVFLWLGKVRQVSVMMSAFMCSKAHWWVGVHLSIDLPVSEINSARKWAQW